MRVTFLMCVSDSYKTLARLALPDLRRVHVGVS
jgi:hypothetical protein